MSLGQERKYQHKFVLTQTFRMLPKCNSLSSVIKIIATALSGYMIINLCVSITRKTFGTSTPPFDQVSESEFHEKIPPPYTNPAESLRSKLSDTEFRNWLNQESWNQDDQELVDAVKRRYLIPPSTKPYNLTFSSATKTNPSDGQVQAVEDLLRKLTPGFFIECGANDGERKSNTLWLEKEQGWTGLLVEADPYAFRKLLSTNRKAWFANLCLSGSTYPKPVTFYRNPISSEAGGLIYDPYYGAVLPVHAQSVPLYTLLLGLNRSVVDFFSLDVEGNEMEILRTIPFDRVTFKILTIEHLFIAEGKKALRNFMKKKGYVLYKTIKTNYTGDSIFVHPSLLNLDVEQN